MQQTASVTPVLFKSKIKTFFLFLKTSNQLLCVSGGSVLESVGGVRGYVLRLLVLFVGGCSPFLLKMFFVALLLLLLLFLFIIFFYTCYMLLLLCTAHCNEMCCINKSASSCIVF